MGIVEHLGDHVRALDTATNARTLDIRVGPFWIAIRTSVGTGMASTMARDARPHERVPVTDAGRLHRLSPLELTHLLHARSPTEAAIGLAATNALIGAPAGTVTSDKALDILIERGRGRTVAMIGRFPFAESLRPVCQRLLVFERGGHGRREDHTTHEIPSLLPSAEIVAITATTLLNGTIDDVLPHVANNAWTMMLGPSTPMTPILFEHGFDALCGTLVEDPAAVLAAVSEGAVTKQIGGVRRLCLWR